MPATSTPTAPAAAPPSAPAPKPSPAPAAKPTTPAAPVKPSTPTKIEALPEKTDAFAEAFADLDELDKGKKTFEPRRQKEVEKITPPKPSQDTPKDESDASLAEPPDPGTTPSTPKDGDASTAELPKSKSLDELLNRTPNRVSELRDAYNELKHTVKQGLKPELEQLRNKVKELESSPQDGKVLAEKLGAIEKRNAELEEHIKFVDYQKSKEYQEEYFQPYVKAWENARRELKGLQIEYQDRDTGEAKSREVTDADLQYLANLEPVQRRAEINRLFPNDKEEVKRHINEITRLAEATEKALDNAKKTGSERIKQTEAQQAAAEQHRVSLWKEVNETLKTKYPAWFAPTEGDEEGNRQLSRGTALANLMFSPNDLRPEEIDLLPKAFADTIKSKQPFSQEQMVQLHAIAYNKFRNHDRLALQLKNSKARIAELENELKQFEESSPDNIKAGERKQTNGKPWMEDAAAELDMLDRKAR